MMRKRKNRPGTNQEILRFVNAWVERVLDKIAFDYFGKPLRYLKREDQKIVEAITVRYLYTQYGVTAREE